MPGRVALPDLNIPTQVNSTGCGLINVFASDLFESEWIYLIFIILIAYLWLLGSFLIFVIGLINIYLIRRSKNKIQLKDIFIILIPIFFTLFRLLVKCKVTDSQFDLPIY